MKLYCYPASKDSAYVPLLFADSRYRPIYRGDGSIRRALAELKRGLPAILHIHWEEFVLRDCQSTVDADAAAMSIVDEIASFKASGGILFWTIHDELPHVIPFHDQFLVMRRALATFSDVVLIHNHASGAVLARQCDIASSKLRLLPHPSYLGRHEDEATLQAGLDQPIERRIQCFGWLRLQKGFAAMLDMLPADFLSDRALQLRISGHGEEAEAVIAERPDRHDLAWDVRHVPDREVPTLLRSAVCVILPYERVLTSGVALLAMSVGAMIVAVDIPQLRELLPTDAQRFLYSQGDGGALRAAIDAVLTLPEQERQAIIAANLAVVEGIHPRIISARLATLYDAALQDRHIASS